MKKRMLATATASARHCCCSAFATANAKDVAVSLTGDRGSAGRDDLGEGRRQDHDRRRQGREPAASRPAGVVGTAAHIH